MSTVTKKQPALKKVNQQSFVKVDESKISIDELSNGMLVWFIPEDSGPRTGLIVKIITKGTQKVDILWQKSGDNYTVRRTSIDRVQGKVQYENIEKHDLAVKNFCQRVLKDGANPTGAAIEAANKFI